jgi:DNA-binding NarL/FixJ family response regulator
MAKIRVLITDDHALFRQGIKTLVGSEPDMEIVGEAANAAEAIALAAEAKPDIVLMDIGMLGLSSFEATRQIRKDRPECTTMKITWSNAWNPEPPVTSSKTAPRPSC